VNRLHLFEIVDFPLCPAVVRDATTDFIAFMLNSHRGFNTLAPKLRQAIERTNVTRIVDLCSGGGGPWLTLEQELSKDRDLTVVLTDLFPNRNCRDTLTRSQGRFVCWERPVDATSVPADLDGLRTIMSSFHHFAPAQARSILADAVGKRQGIVVIEGSDSRLRGLAMMMLWPWLILALMPFVRPFRISRLLLTYCLPVLPLVGLWDGSVSMLRTYSPRELRSLIAGVPGNESFEWDVGTTAVPGSPLGLTYLIGLPKVGERAQC
jgi:hypothetical protein